MSGARASMPDVTPTPAPAAASAGARGAAPRWVLVVGAGAGGLALTSAFAPLGWWPGAVVGVALVAAVVRWAPGARASVLLVGLAGLVHNATALTWESALNVESYVGLALVEALYFLPLGWGLFAVRGWRGAPVVSAGLWTAMEFVQARWPFGGFAWTRLGYGVLESPLAGFYPFVGAGATTFVVALLGCLLAWVPGRRPRRAALVAAVAAVLAFGVGALGGLYRPDVGASQGRVAVGYVQGGAPGGGIYGLGTPRTMTYNLARELGEFARRVEAGQVPRPAFVVGPENSTDMDPTLDDETGRVVAQAVQRVGVPVVVGSPMAGPGPDQRQTSALWWTPRDGITDRYDKRDLVPFGEWIPFRDALLPLLPILRAAGEQTVPGPGPNPLNAGDGLGVGMAICFEVAFPQTLYDQVDAGAQIVAVQSNNSMFRGTPQLAQQFDITRVRAAEMRRQILVVTTTGASGVIAPDGSVAVAVPFDDPASGVAELDRSAVRTPVMRGGGLAEPAIAASASVWLAVGLIAARRRRHGEQWRAHSAAREERHA